MSYIEDNDVGGKYAEFLAEASLFAESLMKYSDDELKESVTNNPYDSEYTNTAMSIARTSNPLSSKQRTFLIRYLSYDTRSY